MVSAKPRLTSWRPSSLVVNPVIVRADEDPFQRPESEIGVRMLEGQDTAVDNQEGRRYRTVGKQHDGGDEGQEVGNMNEGMCAEDREHAHVLLRMVQLVEAPEHPTR